MRDDASAEQIAAAPVSQRRTTIVLRHCAACIGLLAVSCRGGEHGPPAPPLPLPPQARTVSADSTYFGTTVRDPYRWLEQGDSPDVKQWIDAQNAYTDSIVKLFNQGAEFEKRIETLATTSADRFSPVIAGNTLYYLRETPPQPQPVLVASRWPSGPEKVLVDVNASGGGTTIAAYWPSPSGQLLAYGTAEDGSELTTVHFMDARTGEALPDTLPYAGGGTSPQTLAWDADEQGVVYARYPVPDSGAPLRPFDVALYHHRFGVPDDSAEFGAGYSPIAEYRLFTSDDGRHVAALANKGDGGPAEVYLRGKDGWTRALDGSAGVTTASYVGSRLLVVATAGAPHGRIMAVAPDGSTSNVLDEGDWAIQGIAPLAGGMLVLRVSGPDWRVEHYAASGALVRTVKLPAGGIGVDGIASSSASSDALFSWSGWSTPPRWQRYDGRTGRLTTLFEVKAAADYSGVTSRVIQATSKDGTRVPVTVLAMGGTPQDGSAPAILYGYGGFGIPTAPFFIGPYLAWLERGGVLAYANIRGGGEFGEAWHQAGMKTHKQNVFDDFYAAAQELVRQKWTSTDRLGIRGGSNGGLLMGAELTQHPEAFRAVVSMVGIYDMVRHQTFPNGAFNVTEYGDTSDSAEFAALYGYSPLQHVKKGTAYPSVLMETGVNDPRVAPWQSRKFAAALQSATTSGHPVALLTRMEAGHGIGAPFAQRVGNTALTLTFFAHELGLAPVDSTRAVLNDSSRKVEVKRH